MISTSRCGTSIDRMSTLYLVLYCTVPVQLLSNEVVVGGAFTLGQLQNGAVLPTLAAQNITVSSDFPPSDPDRAVRMMSKQCGVCCGMPVSAK